ncbi:DUF2130 domain-containing protein [Flavisolibacter tropicus]|uniref:Caldesmon n=1 Tax=Flavisolibacter tropicus TaxID=1492898 RepID=A0A172U2E4_9BACT|nr:DUF2130 domain-containing protein [Flavisolibacter tropicus]ANE53157.1 hypothetical protein SY85_24480 [Flavisolibacter tropicus]
MPTHIKCPACATSFDVQDVLSADVEQKLKLEYEKRLQQSLSQIEAERKKLTEQEEEFEKKRKNQNELFRQQLEKEKQKLEAQALADKQKLEVDLQQQLRKSISQDFENQLRILKQSDEEKEEKLRTAQKKELEFLKKEQELKNKEQELELQLQKKLLEGRQTLLEQVRKDEEQRLAMKEEEHLFKMKDLQMQLEEQKKLIEEMKRRAEQGSMQRQGEVQELLLEELLKDHFPFDIIGEVGKGVEGADCIQTVRNHLGNDCGKIIFESKRTKTFNNGWIDKLKADMRSKGADVAILVTQTYPKDFKCFGELDGVWVCSFSEVLPLTTAMRHTIMRVAETKKGEENKGEKMQLLYDYLTGNEFRQQMETIVEGFLSMKTSIDKERIQMEKLWKEREKQLHKVLMSTSGLYGSIKGIAGASVGNIPLLEDDGMEEEEDQRLLVK